MPLLLLKLIFDKIEQNPMVFSAANRPCGSFINPQITLHLDFMEAELGKSTWLAREDFTVTDIISFPLEAVAARAGLNASRPNLMAFLNRIHTRPAYQKALDRGGDYELLG